MKSPSLRPPTKRRLCGLGVLGVEVNSKATSLGAWVGLLVWGGVVVVVGSGFLHIGGGFLDVRVRTWWCVCVTYGFWRIVCIVWSTKRDVILLVSSRYGGA